MLSCSISNHSHYIILQTGSSPHLQVEKHVILLDIVDETLYWMDENPEADKDDYDAKQKEVENIANPIMRSFYAGGGGGEDDMGDFGDDEL